MTVHDQLFKELLEARLGDFLEIVVPHLAPHLETEKGRILPNETFTDRPRGRQRVLDLVAEVPDRHREGSELVLVHVEIERDRRASMARRMWAYAHALALREDRPILPIVLYLRGGPPQPTRRTVRQTIAGESFATFSYYAFGLSGSPAEEYVVRPQPLAWALAALMRPPADWSPARHLLECLAPITEAAAPSLDEATRFLLLNCAETYVELTGNDQEEFEMLRDRKGYPRLEDIKMTWADRMRAEARVEESLRLLSSQIEARFGALSEPSRRKLEQMVSDDRADDLAIRLLDAHSLEELGLS